VPANYSWGGRTRKQHSGKGTVRDMSVEGIFVMSPNCPKLGDKVDIDIGPSAPRCGKGTLIQARMKVLRIDFENDRQVGFAAHGKIFTEGRRGGKRSGHGAPTPFVIGAPHREPKQTVGAQDITALIART